MVSNKLITFFIPNLEGGGAERVVVLLAGALAEQGLNVDLVLAQAKGPYLNEVPATVRVVDLKARRVLAALPKLVNYLRTANPYILFSTLTHANLAALLACRITRLHCKVIVREANVLFADEGKIRSLKQRLLLEGARFLYPLAYTVIAVSEQVKKDLIKLGIPPAKVRVIPNPIDIERLESMAACEPAHPWFKDDVIPVILGVGRLVPQKDFPTLIKAFAEVQRHRRVRLAILGEGPDRPTLEKLVAQLGLEKSVVFLGFATNPFPYIKNASVVVLSSRWEGFPNVLLQALALGTPVVSTDCPSGPRELLADGRYGKLVKVGDIKGLAEAILVTLCEPRNSENLKARAQTYSLEKIVAEYLTFLL